MSQPRPQVQPVNGKRPSTQRGQDAPSSQHDDLIKFICDSWNKVSREFEHFNQNGSENSKGGPSVIYYVEQDPNPLLKGDVGTNVIIVDQLLSSIPKL